MQNNFPTMGLSTNWVDVPNATQVQQMFFYHHRQLPLFATGPQLNETQPKKTEAANKYQNSTH